MSGRPSTTPFVDYCSYMTIPVSGFDVTGGYKVGTGKACKAYGQICNQALGGGVVVGKTRSQ